MKGYVKRILELALGLILCAVGLYLTIQANIGLAPWEAFNLGVSMALGVTYGQVMFWGGMVILVVDLLMKEKCGVGTFANIFLISYIMDFFLYMDLIPLQTNFFAGVAMMLLGQVVICVGIYYYIKPGMGAGPRDSLMVALCKYMPKIPVGVIRGVIEGSVLLIGWLLGAKVGLGTVLYVFGLGSIMEMVFRLYHFDVKSVRHESFADTWHNLTKKS